MRQAKESLHQLSRIYLRRSLYFKMASFAFRCIRSSSGRSAARGYLLTGVAVFSPALWQANRRHLRCDAFSSPPTTMTRSPLREDTSPSTKADTIRQLSSGAFTGMARQISILEIQSVLKRTAERSDNFNQKLTINNLPRLPCRSCCELLLTHPGPDGRYRGVVFGCELISHVSPPAS